MSDGEGSDRPALGDFRSWPDHWQAQGMTWRTEREIDADRQRYLAERRVVQPDIERGIYPFRDENGSITVTRADVEWLIATFQSAETVKTAIELSATGTGRVRLDLRGASLEGVHLEGLPLTGLQAGMGKEWRNAPADQREASRIHLNGANLSRCLLQGAALSGASLQGATLFDAHLEGALLGSAHLEQAMLNGAHLAGAFLAGAYLDEATNLTSVSVASRADGSASVVDVRWRNSNVANVWSNVAVLGDEQEARRRRTSDGKRKNARTRLEDFERAVRAYRQLAIHLTSQGLNVEADRLAYRAQLMQRAVLRRQAFLRQKDQRVGLYQRIRKLAAYLGSGLLDLTAGYGYRPGRSIVMYVATIAVFAVLYWCVTNDVSLTHGWFTQAITWLGMKPPPASPDPLQGYEAVVVSMTSFHGRGFFQPVQSPGDKVAILGAIEAAIGLLLEITFIATFTQRFFSR